MKKIFQFHKGTIKKSTSTKLPRMKLFQFHKGTIKTFGSTVYVNPLRISIP